MNVLVPLFFVALACALAWATWKLEQAAPPVSHPAGYLVCYDQDGTEKYRRAYNVQAVPVNDVTWRMYHSAWGYTIAKTPVGLRCETYRTEELPHGVEQ